MKYLLLIFALLIIPPLNAGLPKESNEYVYLSRQEYVQLTETIDSLQTKLDNICRLMSNAKPGVKVYLTPDIIAALLDYSGPDIIITSAYRSDNPRSKHYYGKAIDISTKLNFDSFISYLDSPTGQDWLKKHKLKYNIENYAPYRRHPAYRYNPRATGPHVHIYSR